MSRIEVQDQGQDHFSPIQVPGISTAEKLGKALTGILRAARLILVLALVYVYLDFVFSLFPWTRLLSRRLADYVLDPLQKIWLAVVNFIPSLILIILVVVAARIGLKLIRSFFRGIEKRHHHPRLRS